MKEHKQQKQLTEQRVRTIARQIAKEEIKKYHAERMELIKKYFPSYR